MSAGLSSFATIFFRLAERSQTIPISFCAISFPSIVTFSGVVEPFPFSDFCCCVCCCCGSGFCLSIFPPGTLSFSFKVLSSLLLDNNSTIFVRAAITSSILGFHCSILFFIIQCFSCFFFLFPWVRRLTSFLKSICLSETVSRSHSLLFI